jgi:hypothetical protein
MALLTSIRRELEAEGLWRTDAGRQLFLRAVCQDIAIGEVSREDARAVLAEAGYPNVTFEQMDAAAGVAALQALVEDLAERGVEPASDRDSVQRLCEIMVAALEGQEGEPGQALLVALGWLRELDPANPLLARARRLGVIVDEA